MVRAARLWCRKSPLRLGFAMRRLENSLCHSSSKWVPFSNQGRIRHRKERDGLCLSSAVPKIQWDSDLHCPYGYKTMGNLYLSNVPLPFLGQKTLIILKKIGNTWQDFANDGLREGKLKWSYTVS